MPNTAASFNMRASILKDVTYPELTPSVDFSVILTPTEQKQFAALCSAFAKYAATDLDAMDRCVVEMENSIKEYLYTLEYYPIVGVGRWLEW